MEVVALREFGSYLGLKSPKPLGAHVHHGLLDLKDTAHEEQWRL